MRSSGGIGGTLHNRVSGRRVFGDRPGDPLPGLPMPVPQSSGSVNICIAVRCRDVVDSVLPNVAVVGHRPVGSRRGGWAKSIFSPPGLLRNTTPPALGGEYAGNPSFHHTTGDG